MADTPKVPQPHPCEPGNIISSGYGIWEKRISGKEVNLEKKEKGGKY